MAGGPIGIRSGRPLRTEPNDFASPRFVPRRVALVTRKLDSMRENLTGLIKIIGIALLLFVLWGVLAWQVPEKFLSPANVENLLRRTALYGILGVGVALVIITSGIDLSLGSLVCLCGCLLAIFLQVDYQPAQQTNVWEIKADPPALVVPADLSIQPGQKIRLFGARKARNLVAEVTAVEPVSFDDRPALLLALDQKPSRSDRIESGVQQVGRLTLAYPLLELKDGSTESTESNQAVHSQVVVAADRLGLAKRDRLLLVGVAGGLAERPVESVEPLSEKTRFVVRGDLAGVDIRAVAIPVRRHQRMSVALAVGWVMLIAGGLGLIHGLLVTMLRLQPFVVTLCGLLAYRGLARRLSNDQALGFGDEYADTLGALSTGKWVLWESADASEAFGIPYVFFILIAVAVAAAVFLNLTIWGRYTLALGKNQEAARFSGIHTGRMICLAYLLCGLATGLGGILHSIDANSISPGSFGNLFELWAIAAAVLGGCSLRGGEGGIIGVIVGTALMQTLYSMIVLLQIPSEMEYVIIGSVILVAVIADELIRRLANRVRT